MKKQVIISFILGAIIFGGVGTILAYKLAANQVGYTPEDSNWNVSDVDTALNDLYDMASFGDAQASDIKSGKTALVNGNQVTGTLDVSSISGGGNNEVSETILWENPDSSSNVFSSQIISLNDDMNNYNYLELIYKHSGNNSDTFKEIVSVNDFKKTTTESTRSLLWYIGGTDSNNTSWIRYLSYVANNKIYIENCISGQWSDTTIAIPLKINGIRKNNAIKVGSFTTRGVSYVMQKDGYIKGTVSRGKDNNSRAVIYFDDLEMQLSCYLCDDVYDVNIFAKSGTNVRTRSDGGTYNLDIYEFN